MSSTQNPTTLQSKLEALQCHFTWDLHLSGSHLLRVRDKLEDFGLEEGNSWLAHIYNQQGYIHYKLGSTEEAQRFFNKAAETFKNTRPDKTEEGPWLVVNYGNQAWLHHHLGNQAESQKYLSKVQDLMEKYPPPPQEELHPEVCAEKAFTMMKFSGDKQLVLEYFERAIRMQPDRVEWNTSYVTGLVNSFRCYNVKMEIDILKELRSAREKDPENLYLAVLFLERRAAEGQVDEDEARELAGKILSNPVNIHSGLRLLLKFYRDFISVDEAIHLSEEAVNRYPDIRYLKKCAALCYKWKILFSKDSRPEQAVIDRAISLYEELISLYPHSSFPKRLDLAKIHAKSNHSQDEAEQIFQKLLEKDVDPEDKQMLYNSYAKHLFFNKKDMRGSVQYHKKAAEIPHQSFFREKSITSLKGPALHAGGCAWYTCQACLHVCGVFCLCVSIKDVSVRWKVSLFF
ncbi:uncharacterized protein V6R79_007362 [Siganus canaliculatus]